MEKQTEQSPFKKTLLKSPNSFVKKMLFFVNDILYRWKNRPVSTKENIHTEDHQTIKNKSINKELSDSFDLSLSHNMNLLALELIFNGYHPSEKQAFVLKESVIKSIHQDIYFILNLKKFNYPLDNTIILPWCYYYFNQIKSHENLNLILEESISDNFYQDFFSFILSQLNLSTKKILKDIFVEHKSLGCIGNKNHTIVNKFHDMMKYQHFLLTIIEPFLDMQFFVQYHEELKNTYHKFQGYLNNLKSHGGHYGEKYQGENQRNLGVEHFEKYIQNVNQLIQNKLSGKKQHLIKQANSLEKTNYLAQVNQDVQLQIIHTIGKLSIEKELSSSALEIVNHIHELYEKISESSQFSQDNDFHDIESAYKNQLPMILKKYLSIDQSLRNELVNLDGKTSEELMILSLKNVEDILDKKFIEINQNKLSDLSVTYRMTSQMKKNM